MPLIILCMILILLLPSAMISDETRTTTLLKANMHASSDDPYIIEDMEISTNGHGIVLRNCENVIIRNCTIQLCAYDEEDVSGDIDAPGTGIFIEDCKNVTIE